MMMNNVARNDEQRDVRDSALLIERLITGSIISDDRQESKQSSTMGHTSFLLGKKKLNSKRKI